MPLQYIKLNGKKVKLNKKVIYLDQTQLLSKKYLFL